MTRIARVEHFHVRVPLPATFYPSWIPGFPQRQNRMDIIRITTDDGVEGISAGMAMGHERKGLGTLIGPYLLGEDPTDLRVMRQRLREVSYLGWRNAWIEPAFWDIKGKLEGKPVCTLLGGEPRSVRCYASTGSVMSPEQCVEAAEARYEEGFRAIKLRVHDFDEAVDIEQVTETAKAVGDRMKIGVDANQGWRVEVISDAPLWDLARAKRFADACADAGLAWIEEPLPMDGYDDLTALTAYSKVPIAGGELHTSGLPELRMMVERRCYSIFQPDAVFCGGIADCTEVAKLCREHGLVFSPHTWTNGIGFAINLHVHAAAGFADEKELEYPVQPPGWVVEARDGILREPFHHDRGAVTVPDKPGLGIELDRGALRRWGTRVSVMDRKRLIWFSLRDRGIAVSKEIDAKRKARMAARAAE